MGKKKNHSGEKGICEKETKKGVPLNKENKKKQNKERSVQSAMENIRKKTCSTKQQRKGPPGRRPNQKTTNKGHRPAWSEGAFKEARKDKKRGESTNPKKPEGGKQRGFPKSEKTSKWGPIRPT